MHSLLLFQHDFSFPHTIFLLVFFKIHSLLLLSIAPLGALFQTSMQLWARQCWCRSSAWWQCRSYSSMPTSLLISGRAMTTFIAAALTVQVTNKYVNQYANTYTYSICLCTWMDLNDRGSDVYKTLWCADSKHFPILLFTPFKAAI